MRILNTKTSIHILGVLSSYDDVNNNIRVKVTQDDIELYQNLKVCSDLLSKIKERLSDVMAKEANFKGCLAIDNHQCTLLITDVIFSCDQHLEYLKSNEIIYTYDTYKEEN